MSSIRQRPSEAAWDACKGVIRRLYLQQKLPVESVLQYLQEHGLNISKAQLEYKLRQWKFRQNMTQEAWNYVLHEISRRERVGKKSDVILCGVKLRPEVVRKETQRNRPLPRLGRSQPSPSPKPPSNLPLMFRNQFQEIEYKNLSSSILYSGSPLSLLPARNIDVIDALCRYAALPSRITKLVPSDVWNQQCLPKISAYMGLVIPEVREGENLARADILVSGSSSEKLQHILEIFIVTVSNRICEWDDIATTWNVLQHVLEWALASVPNRNLLESQTMKAFSDTLFREAFDHSIKALGNHIVEGSNTEIAHQVIAWLLRSGFNPNRPHTWHFPYFSRGRYLIPALQHAVAFGDKFQNMVKLLIEFGADIYASDESGRFSALQIVLDENAMKYWTGSNPQIALLQEIFIEKAVKDPNRDNSQMLAEHALRHGNKSLLESLLKGGFNLGFCRPTDFGLSSETTALSCAAQFCPRSQEDPWDVWVSFILHHMSPSDRSFSNWPAQRFADPLIYAAGAGNTVAICYFLDRGGLLDVQNKDGISPLIAAVARGQTVACKLLLSLGADRHKTGPYGISAIHVAAITGQYEMIQLLANPLVDKRGTIHIDDRSWEFLSRLLVKQLIRDGVYTTLDIILTLLSCKGNRWEECLKILLRNGFCSSSFRLLSNLFKEFRLFSKDEDLLDIMSEAHLKVYSSENSRIMHTDLRKMIMRCAILSGCPGIIKKHFDNRLELQGDEIPAVLSRGDTETAAVIIGLGIDIKTKRPNDPSFLEAAILSRDQRTINWALAADTEYYDPGALCAAVEIALEPEGVLCYKDVLTRRPKTAIAHILESTAVGIAAGGNKMQLLRDLLSIIPRSSYCHMREDWVFNDKFPDPRNREFWRNFCFKGSPLTYALGMGREENFALMLERGYQPDESTLFRAIEVGSFEQIKLIYGSGVGDLIVGSPSCHSASILKVPFNMSILLQIAARRNRTDVIQWLLAQNLVIGEWLEHWILKMSPLQYAVDNGNLELITMLLRHGVSPNEEPKVDGSTALQLAAKRGYIGIAKILISHEPPADVNAHRSVFRGLTALESAAATGRLDMVQFLLCNGAKTEGTGQRQYIRAIKLARDAQCIEIVNILMSHREWTQQDEELFRKEDIRARPGVDESECSDSECRLPHKYKPLGGLAEDGEITTVVYRLFEFSGSKCFSLTDESQSVDRLDPGIQEDEYRDDDSGLVSVDGNIDKEDMKNRSIDSTSTPWSEEMTLEEAEAAFISWDED
ncbi:hypothetical protein GGS24DRAFT_508997 [Hypoxylon argillaceum]|nr:hypothetical protein GGS24DRAFT_508997 [Hypoxylon argillaceum]